MVLCNWGSTLKQSSAVHIQALVSADGILLGSSSKLRLLVINLASVPGGQLVNSPTAAILDRKVQARFCLKLWRSFFVFKLFNFEFLFNKFITAFWVGHLPFLQVGFVTVRALAAWLR